MKALLASFGFGVVNFVFAFPAIWVSYSIPSKPVSVLPKGSHRLFGHPTAWKTTIRKISGYH
jgi:hypothetical protein